MEDCALDYMLDHAQIEYPLSVKRDTQKCFSLAHWRDHRLLYYTASFSLVPPHQRHTDHLKEKVRPPCSTVEKELYLHLVVALNGLYRHLPAEVLPLCGNLLQCEFLWFPW